LSLGFHEADPYAGNAATYFDSDVKRVVDAGHVWWGEGQPQAAAVMQTNSLALEACKLQMRAGMAATDGLYRTITKAQQELESVLSEIDAKTGEGDGVHYTVEDDGTVKYGTYPTSDNVGSTNTVPDPTLSEHRELTYRVQRVLNYANTADLTGAALLERIANSTPAFTENVSPQALVYNQAVVALARANATLAEQLQDLWEHTSPSTWGGAITPEWKAWLDGFDNPATRAYNELPGPIVGKVIGTPLLLFGTGWGLGEGLVKSRTQNRIPELDDPSNLLALKPSVEDDDLQDIVDDLYSGLRFTPDELAQLPHGGLDAGDMDDLRDVRERLGDWIDGSYDELADGVQESTHTELVPLGGSHWGPTQVPDPHTLDHYGPEDFAISPGDRKAARQLYSQLSTVLAGKTREPAGSR
ncbi:MAG: hypothetical protein ACRDQA_28015, partial [Nocardioidaceae bacterium]